MSGEFDDLDWEDLKRVARNPTAHVTIGLVKKTTKATGKSSCAYAVIWLRRQSAAWIGIHGPRFKVQIAANFLRLIPDAKGPFTSFDFRGVKKLALGGVNIWPDEKRRAISVDHKITAGGLVVILPKDFSEPKQLAGSTVGEKPATRQALVVRQPSPLFDEKATHPAALAANGAASSEDDKILKAALGVTNSFPRFLGKVKITAAEGEILEALLKRNECGRAALMIATHDGIGDDYRAEKIIDVLICRLRPKLTHLGISIESCYGGLFRMNAVSKAVLRKLIEEERSVAT
jgi:hypothetical protein